MGRAHKVEAPVGALHIDGDGGYLMPGLAEMHGHLPSPTSDAPERWRSDVLFLYLANGVTTVRGMQGNESHLALRRRIASGEVLGPRLYVAGPALRGRNLDSQLQGMEAVID